MSFSTLKGRFRPFALCECDSNRLDGNIFSFFDRLLQISFAEHNVVLRNSRTGYCLRRFYSGTAYHFQEFDSGTGWLFRFSGGTSSYFRRSSTLQGGYRIIRSGGIEENYLHAGSICLTSLRPRLLSKAKLNRGANHFLK